MMEKNEEFKDLYMLYRRQFRKTHKEGEPVCFNEWIDNELNELRKSYRRYLQEAVLDDEDFDEATTEDFYTFAEEEIKDPIW